jgi:hypothetical protein
MTTSPQPAASPKKGGNPDPKREMLRHTVATLAYRGGKTLRGVPPGFGGFRIGAKTRTPIEILVHLGDLLEWALSLAEGWEYSPKPSDRSWEQETERFFAALAGFDVYLAGEGRLAAPPAALFQGPVADALTHVGQIALLRRMAEAPVRGENYFVADIKAGRVGADQAAARREFD